MIEPTTAPPQPPPPMKEEPLPLAENRPWYRDITAYQWLILVLACAGWIFDIYENQIFAVTRGNMLGRRLASARPPLLRAPSKHGRRAPDRARHPRGRRAEKCRVPRPLRSQGPVLFTLAAAPRIPCRRQEPLSMT